MRSGAEKTKTLIKNAHTSRTYCVHNYYTEHTLTWHYTSRTRRKQDIEQEERRPAQHEGEEHQPEDLGGLLLVGDRVGGERTTFFPVCEEPATKKIIV